MDQQELKKRVGELVARIEVYANLPEDTPAKQALLNELRKDAQKLYDEINALPSVPERYRLFDHIIRGLIEGGIIESVIKALVDIFS
jgi:hypothetical protein